jgi:hypothetical protein
MQTAANATVGNDYAETSVTFLANALHSPTSITIIPARIIENGVRLTKIAHSISKSFSCI